ncbi:MAG: hypothetical protein LC792_24670, partial [Actinobacteria bacterium]|nr:hypothetical protein [Actinomycetota bacterium]
MIEPEAVIDPEAVPPAPQAGRRRRALIAGVTLLAMVAGGVAIAAGTGRTEPRPLALMVSDGRSAGGTAESQTMAAPAIARAPGATTDSELAAPYP